MARRIQNLICALLVGAILATPAVGLYHRFGALGLGAVIFALACVLVITWPQKDKPGTPGR